MADTNNTFNEFRALIARLRAPDGCPWDRKQTHKTLRTTLLEETYEVLHAMDTASPGMLREELGDLLLQIMLNAQIADDNGDFDIDDVIRDIHKKIVSRHPHVFGTATANNAAEVSQRWEELKKQERGDQGSILDSAPRELPALAYAYSLQRRAAGVGFDWEKVDDVLDKVSEELAELKQAKTQQRIEEEFGDLMFTLVNVGRHMDVDLEVALRGSAGRFRQRFQWMENTARERGTTLDRLSLQQQDALWHEAKNKLSDG